MTSIDLILFLIFISSLIFYFIQRQFNYWKNLEIQFEAPEFPYGNFKGVPGKFHPLEVHKRIYEKFKKSKAPFAGIFAFFEPVVLVTNLEFARTVFTKDSANFTDRGAYYNEVDNPISAHLFNLDNPKWKILRNKLTPTFTSGKMKMMFETVVDVGERFVRKLTSEIEKEEAIDVKEFAARFTTDVIGSIGFGLEINSLDNPTNEFRMRGVQAFNSKYNALVTQFILTFKNFCRFLRVSTIQKDLEAFFIKIVRDTVEHREKNSIVRNDFMNLLIQLKNDGKLDGESTEIGKLSMNEIAAQSFIFFAAGYETSSTTMSFLLHELALNQEIQDKARENVLDVLGRFDGKLSYEALNEMDYLGNCINESLRKYPPVTVLARYCSEDYFVESTNYFIKKGQLVLIPAYAIHHDPEIYPNPEIFDPNRFSAQESANRSQYAFMPFGHGPRNCIGLRFGVMQAKIGLAMLLKNFKFETCEKTENPIQIKKKSVNIMLGSLNGIYLKITKI